MSPRLDTDHYQVVICMQYRMNLDTDHCQVVNYPIQKKASKYRRKRKTGTVSLEAFKRPRGRKSPETRKSLNDVKINNKKINYRTGMAKIP